jgi:hypothetical protein
LKDCIESLLLFVHHFLSPYSQIYIPEVRLEIHIDPYPAIMAVFGLSVMAWWWSIPPDLSGWFPPL